MKIKLRTTAYCYANLLVAFILTLLISSPALAQVKTFATQIVNEENVSNSNAVLTPNEGDFATLNSYGGIAVGVGSYKGDLEVSFPSTVPANTTSYIKIDFDNDILNYLLGGSLGNLAADLVGNIALGDHRFEVEASFFDGSSTSSIYTLSSTTVGSSYRQRVVRGANGDFFIAITPDQDYNRIRVSDITSNLLLGVNHQMNVYNVFYFNTDSCLPFAQVTDFDGQGVTLDVLGLGGAGVQDSFHVIDNDPDNFSQISLGVVGVAANMQQNVYFPSTKATDQNVSVTLKTDPALLTLGLLNNVQVIAYNQGSAVYTGTISTLINLDALTLLQNGQRAIVTISPNQEFDQIAIRLNSLLNVNLVQSLDVYEITTAVAPPTTTEPEQTFCASLLSNLLDLNVNGNNLIFYDQADGGTAYNSTDALIDGEIYYAAQVGVNGCESETRLAITVNIEDLLTPTTNLINQIFCSTELATIASLQVNESNVIFYDQAIGGTAYDSTDALIDGKIYYAAQVGANGCESETRLAITVNIEDLLAPTTNLINQIFCSSELATVASLQVNESDVIFYDQATGGTAYDSTDTLIDGEVYFAAQVGANGCESETRLAITVNIEDLLTPTTNLTNQLFCSTEVATVASLQVNESNVIFYDQAIGGTAYDSTDALVDGEVYFAVQVGANGCESETRLAITVNIENLLSPTTNLINQIFCSTEIATIASLQVNESNVIFYDQAIGGTAYDSTDALVDGEVYFAAQVGANGCESETRLAITVNIEDLLTPTTSLINQIFCSTELATIASLQVNESNVIFYDQAIGGTAYDSSDALVDGEVYFAAQVGANGCESETRLAITVNIEDLLTPTTSLINQIFCSTELATIASLQVNESNVIFYDQATGGTAYDSTDALIDGEVYFATQVGANGCESETRLAITVNIEDLLAPTTNLINQIFCSTGLATVASLQINETNVIFYDQAIGGTAYDSNDALIDGQVYFAAQFGTNGCESETRLAITVNIEDLLTPTTNLTNQIFCSTELATIASLQVNEFNVIFYDQAIGGSTYDSTDALIDGEVYFAAQVGTNGCESETRLAIMVNIEDLLTPTTNLTNQIFCSTELATIASLQVNESDVIFYDQAIGGTAYDSTDTLIDGEVYFAAQIGANGCESETRLAITVNIEDLLTPTTNLTNQLFCSTELATIASLQINESNVIFYDQAIGGTAYDSTDALIDGEIYYAAQIGANGCESGTRLAITVNIEDLPTPTTSLINQIFCSTEVATVASLQVNESNVIFYDQAIGGTAYDSTDALIDGEVYFATQVGANGCESSTRLAITVNIENIAAPTTNAAEQMFCSIDNATIGSLQVNESNVIFYDQAIGGTAYDSTDALMDGGIYYAAQVSSNGCESETRLAITVRLGSLPAPTTMNVNQEFCESDSPTILDLQVNESNVLFYAQPVGGDPLSGNESLENGQTYYVASVSSGSCESDDRLAIMVSVKVDPMPSINSDTTGEVCMGTTVTYITESGHSNYNWTVNGGDIVDGGTTNDSMISVQWMDDEEGTISVAYDDPTFCNGSSTAFLDVDIMVCADISITKTVDNERPMVGEAVTFTIQVENEGPHPFNNVQVIDDMPSGYSFIDANVTIGSYNSSTNIWTINQLQPNALAVLTIRVKVLGTGDYMNRASVMISNPIDIAPSNNTAQAGTEPLCLIVYNEFTPNGDGMNDRFVISCIENFPDNDLKIYNKYGSLIYTSRNYQNDWDGRANVSNVADQDEVLPAATYYYVLDMKELGTKTGWVYLAL
ncbi:conserved repeat domain-containing protein/gliding motility-associated C-terminal domain-containing protein [Nonlabens sp. Hel1_33_55]|uniref:Ig-like domain-containing protein n=1 Tax=Nonlabens sp. Hel1_33_55 TaxID=1336802 RepID=UPI000875E5AE|nr:gliding motility-associated C-terminal domain-containing protein [Nonlabens sp. Hel1_33_55]SCY07182.1 conserved repeat domain-containing protein/gliding motility-associated C-terminal domain-containing protein [Nonlabens sp. Hel1_33_55]